ncbi:synaptosomal-associated protein 47 [Aplysia californica]|nr:synaptosomal-associated protein 47 [Aplysia californica]
MPAVLVKFESFAKSKMEYMSPPAESSVQRATAPSSVPNDSPSPWSSMQSSPDRDSPKHVPTENDVPQIQARAQKDVVSDAEAAELSATLENLKSLALDISTEQDSQLDMIDRVTQSVDRADYRQKELDKKMNKLLK